VRHHQKNTVYLYYLNSTDDALILRNIMSLFLFCFFEKRNQVFPVMVSMGFSISLVGSILRALCAVNVCTRFICASEPSYPTAVRLYWSDGPKIYEDGLSADVDVNKYRVYFGSTFGGSHKTFHTDTLLLWVWNLSESKDSDFRKMDYTGFWSQVVTFFET
jgi:hypothetical protein